MSSTTSWPVADLITTARLRLEPLRVDHAAEAVTVLRDERLYTWIGGSPPSLAQLAERYRQQSVGHSPDGTQGWLNWMLRRTCDNQLVGTVQATLYRPVPDRIEAELAWVVGVDYQGNGYGREGALAMMWWLRDRSVSGFVAHIHPGHAASIGIARALGLAETPVVSDGEVRWSDAAG